MRAIVLMVIGGSVPPSAKGPLREVFTDEGRFTLPDISCDGFTLTETMDSEAITVTTFFNEAGDPIKVDGPCELLRDDHEHGERPRVPRSRVVHRDENVPVDITTVNGISYHYIVGGKGQVYAEVGHKISVSETGDVIFQGGQDDLASDPGQLNLRDSMT